MLSPEQINTIAQQLINGLEKEIGNIQGRIEGVALLYKLLAEADGTQTNIASSEEKK